MNISKNKPLYKTIIGLFAVTVILLLTGSYLISNARNDTYAEKKLFLEEISSKNALLINTKITDLLSKLESCSMLLCSVGDFDVKEIMPLLIEESARSEFKRMGIITLDGKAVTTDGHVLDFSDREYFMRALHGESNVSSRLTDKVGGETVNVFATPMTVEGNVVAVLFGTKNTDAMAELLTVNGFEGQGYSHIINSDGRPIIYTLDPTAPHGYDDFYDEVALVPENRENLEVMKAEIAAGKNSTITFVRDGVKRQLCYSKIGVDDWYMITTVAADVISKNSDMLVSRIIGVVAIMFIAFLLVSVMIISHFRKVSKNLEIIAFIDEITGYENWNKFKIDWNSWSRKTATKKYAVMALDIAKFRVINDLYSHGKGNTLLKHLAALIDLSLSSGERFTRVSGDNFIILMEYNGNVRVLNLVKYISEQMRDFIPGYIIQMSFGIYVLEDEVNLDASAAYDRANMAKKLVKDRIDINYSFYDESVRYTVLREKDIENEMKSALETGQFQVFLHPKYLVGNGKYIGAEALVRWKHPQKGLIQPNDFIPIFEKNGFVRQLDFYVFEQVCSTLARWKREGRSFASLCISVNLSRVHMGTENLARRLLAITENYGIAPGSIEIELTESAVFNDAGKLILIMQDFKDAGFRLSIDDFGSGYSSLNTLKDLPVDIIKFDRMFLQEATDNIRGKVIITSLIDMAKVLLLETVAEGVETEEQVDFLKKAGCDIAQGFFYAKPMSIKDFEELITSSENIQ